MAVASSQAEGLSLATQQQFEGLRQRFSAGLVLRWRDISQAADRPAQQALLHRLGGSAGSFGFDRLGQLAREAEFLCASGDAAALAACLAQIDAEVKVATQALPLPTIS